MLYFRTKYGQIIDENNQLIPMDEASPLYADYVEYLRNEGTVFETEFVFPEDIETEEKDKTKARWLGCLSGI